MPQYVFLAQVHLIYFYAPQLKEVTWFEIFIKKKVNGDGTEKRQNVNFNTTGLGIRKPYHFKSRNSNSTYF